MKAIDDRRYMPVGMEAFGQVSEACCEISLVVIVLIVVLSRVWIVKLETSSLGFGS